VLGGHLLKPGINAKGLEADGIIGPDQGAGRLAVTQGHPRPQLVRQYKISRRHPASIGDDDLPSCQPITVVDDRVRVTLTLNVDQVRANQTTPPLWSRPYSKGAGNLASERGRAHEKFMNRARQGQWLKGTDGEIFDETKAHNPSVSLRSPGSRDRDF
jgi:hypothetical protein